MYIDKTTMMLIWLAIIVVTLIIEIITQGLTNNWEPPLWIQIAIFCVVSILFMLLARPFAQRMMRNTITPTNIDQLLHEEGVVVEEINAEKQTGHIRLRDVEWIAISDDGEVIPVGEQVAIRRIEGVKLYVTRK